MTYSNSSSSDIVEICNLFAKYFKSVYSQDSSPQNLPYVKEKLSLGNLQVSEDEVMVALKQIDSSKSAGPDGFSAAFIKNAAISLSEPLKIIFNLSLEKGLFLDEWKYSFITPIFKSGSKQYISNYRPICKISVIPKIFEKIITDKILFVVREYISEYQHGFFPGRSTTTNLSLLVNYTILNFENNLQTDIIFTDFAKAFDRVNHKILLHKLYCIGFHSNLLNWIESYLTGRIQIVKIDTYLSDPIYVTSGVPQGSHIGPLLFLLFINDIPDIFLHSKCLLYADDLKLYRKIDSAEDYIFL